MMSCGSAISTRLGPQGKSTTSLNRELDRSRSATSTLYHSPKELKERERERMNKGKIRNEKKELRQASVYRHKNNKKLVRDPWRKTEIGALSDRNYSKLD